MEFSCINAYHWFEPVFAVCYGCVWKYYSLAKWINSSCFQQKKVCMLALYMLTSYNVKHEYGFGPLNI